MPGIYDLAAQRKASAASYIGYKTPSQHPDRIMEEHDLVYFLEGEWEIYQDGIPYTLRSGDVILLHGGRHHFSRRPCQAGTNTIYILLFPADNDRSFPPSPPTQGKTVPVFPDSPYAPENRSQEEPADDLLPEKISCQGSEEVRFLFDAIAKTFALETYKREEKISSLCQLLLRELYACAHHKIPGDIFSAAIGYMVSNSQKICSAGELAQAAHVSERTLRNAFLRRYAMTPCAYQMRYKLRQAAIELMNHPQATIRAVAENLGFCDEFHFSKSFKKEFGIPPSLYREQQAEKMDPLP